MPQGACTGLGSACASAGYALETRCHLGKSIVFDTVNKLGWRVDVRKHPIRNIILEVLEHEFDVWDGWVVDEWGNVRDVPEAVPEDDCVVRTSLFEKSISVDDSADRIATSGSSVNSRRRS